MFESLPIWASIAAFAVAAGVVWRASGYITGILGPIARRFRLGEAFVGMLLLGGITSLPEVATVGTASWQGEAPLAINNVLGSVALNVLFLAVADAILGRRALTATVASPATLLQGVLSMLLLAVAAIAILVGDISVLGVGLWSIVLLLGSVLSFKLASTYADRAPWTVRTDRDGRAPGPAAAPHDEAHGSTSTRGLLLRLAGGAAFVLVAGYVLAETAGQIATAAGIQAGLVGLVLLALATSLPELSAIWTAVGKGRTELVVGDIFGTNVFNMLLIVLADAVYRSGPVLNEAGRFEVVAALIGLVLTGLFVVGLLERRDRTIMRIGYDAAGAIAIYGAGLFVLWQIRGAG